MVCSQLPWEAIRHACQLLRCWWLTWEHPWEPGKGKKVHCCSHPPDLPFLSLTALGHIYHPHLAVVPNPIWQENSCLCWDLSEWGLRGRVWVVLVMCGGVTDEDLLGDASSSFSVLVSSSFSHLGGPHEE